MMNHFYSNQVYNSIKNNTIKINNINLTLVNKNLNFSILEKLYNCINLSKCYYQILNDNAHLNELKKTEYNVTYHVQGFNYIMFMTTINNKPFHCLISKKELKIYLTQNNLNDIKIYTFNMKTSNMYLYFNTVFDGKIIKNDSTFLISDCYYLNGEDMHAVELKTKFNIINNVLNDILELNFKLKLVTLYKYSDIPKLVFENMKNANLKINGLIFYPNYSGKFYIYVNDAEFDNIKNNNQVQINKISNSECDFFIKKTKIPDVYELYFDSSYGNVKEGIAHVPNMKTSRFCKELLKNQDMVKIKCVKSIKFNKWVPLCQDISELDNVLF
jgi:hypothetical protein